MSGKRQLQVTFLEVQVGNTVYPVNIEAGYKYINFYDKLKEVYDYVNSVVDYYFGDYPAILEPQEGESWKSVRLYVCLKNGSNEYSYKFMAGSNGITETLLNYAESTSEVFYSAKSNTPELKIVRTGSQSTDWRDYTILRESSIDWVNEVFEVVRTMMNASVIDSELIAKHIAAENRYPLLAKVTYPSDLPRNTVVPCLVSFNDAVNASIDCMLRADENLDKEVAEELYRELKTAGVNVRLLSYLKF